MGLDLYHIAPSLKTSETLDYFAMDEFESNPDFLKKHLHLLTEIEEPEWGFEILVFPDNLTKAMLLNSIPGYEDKPILVGDIETLHSELNEIATGNSIQKKEPFILRSIDNLSTKETGREVYYHTATYETSSKKINVLYWAVKGYQRKGMNTRFYEDFENDKLYFDKASVLKAGLYLSPTWGNDKEELKQDFKNNFIDNFVEGESIFFGSW